MLISWSKTRIVRTAIFFLLWCLVITATAQNSIGIIRSRQSEAFDLFQSGQYKSVVQLLSEANLELKEKYMVEMSRINLNLGSTSGLESLVDNNPKFPLNSLANFTIGKFYFYQDELALSNRFLKMVNGSILSTSDKAEYYFFLGYISMQNSQFKTAKNYFDRSSTFDTYRQSELAYYQGYIAYHLNSFEEAESILDKVKDHVKFGTSSKFFLAKIKSENKEYEKVISLFEPEMSEEINETNSAFHQLVGEAYAKLGQTINASGFFEKAIQLHPNKPSATLYYQAGVARFKVGQKEKAIDYLKEAGIQSGEYAYLSAFQLARIYVSSDDLMMAASAYIQASGSSDSGISEESLFMAGKLLIGQNNYAEGINYLSDYRIKFPEGKWKAETEYLMIESYLRTSDYDLAIEHLNEMGVTSDLHKKMYQSSTFRKAILMYNDLKFEEAIFWFNESLKYPYDGIINDHANYDLAEAYINLNQYQKAIQAYKLVKKPQNDVYYGLGYAHFNLAQYAEAINYFERFLRNSANSNQAKDAELRLADCYYATKAYNKSLRLYQKIDEADPSGYTRYQKAIVQRNLGFDKLAISSFESVLKINDKSLWDDAVFQIAQVLFENTEFSKAEFHFSSLISKYPQSPLIVEGRLNRAICRTNLGKLDEAKNDYEYILKSFSGNETALNAILGLQELNSKGVVIADLEMYIEKYKKSNPKDKSLEIVEFEFAKSQYFNQDYAKSSISFQKFISNYPNSSDLTNAKYYLAEGYYKEGDLPASYKLFNELKDLRTNLSGRILIRLGEISLELGDLDSSLNSFKRLESLDLSQKDSYNARKGLMTTYFALGDYMNCISSANKIISSDWKPLNSERNARLFRGKSNLQLGNIELAKQDLTTISTTSDFISAEASFLLAKIEFDNATYKESLELLFSFNSKFGSYRDLVDQSYLLIANNYIELGELFQATATLNSIIQHSENQEIQSKAQKKLLEIESLSHQDSIIKQ